MDVTVKMWREDLEKRILFRYELYEDKNLSQFSWWLDLVLK